MIPGEENTRGVRLTMPMTERTPNSHLSSFPPERLRKMSAKLHAAVLYRAEMIAAGHKWTMREEELVPEIKEFGLREFGCKNTSLYLVDNYFLGIFKLSAQDYYTRMSHREYRGITSEIVDVVDEGELKMIHFNKCLDLGRQVTFCDFEKYHQWKVGELDQYKQDVVTYFMAKETGDKATMCRISENYKWGK